MKVKGLIAMSMILLSGSSVMAQKKKALVDEYSGQGYGMGGCGPGSMVFGDKKGMIQVLAAVTNNAYSVQTFAISSGTSNCGEQPKQAKMDQFINVNKLSLEKDMARGQGESLTALGELMGCQNQDFGISMRTQYKQKFPNGNSTPEEIQSIASDSCEI